MLPRDDEVTYGVLCSGLYVNVYDMMREVLRYIYFASNGHVCIGFAEGISLLGRRLRLPLPTIRRAVRQNGRRVERGSVNLHVSQQSPRDGYCGPLRGGGTWLA